MHTLRLSCCQHFVDITLSFEKPRYDVTEQDIELKDLIYVVKEGNKTTEQILEVFVMFSQNVGTKYASRGQFFSLTFTHLTTVYNCCAQLGLTCIKVAIIIFTDCFIVL